MASASRLWFSLMMCALAVACGGETSANGQGAGGTSAGGTSAGGTSAGGTSAGGTSAGGSGGTAGTVGSGGSAGTSVGGAGGAPPSGVVVLDQNDAPIAGARVVVTQPDGSREEQLTDAQGLASFPDIDFALEVVELMAFSPGRTLVSVLDVGPASSRVVHLHPAFAKALFTRILKLSIKNKVVASDCVRITSTVESLPEGVCGDSVDFPILPGEDGQILAAEFVPGAEPTAQPPMKSGVTLDIPSSGDSLEIDLSKSAVVEHASGSVPAMATGPNQSLGMLYASVTSWKSRGGASASFDTSSQKGVAFDWQADFFRPFPEADARSAFSFNGNEGLQVFESTVSLPGYLPGGPLPAFPAPPSMKEPSSGSLFAPITWSAGSERPDHMIVNAVDVLDASNGAWPVWEIWFSPQRDSVTLEKPPDSIWSALDWTNATEVFPGLYFCEPEPASCTGGACTPSQERWCARNTLAIGSVAYTLN